MWRITIRTKYYSFCVATTVFPWCSRYPRRYIYNRKCNCDVIERITNCRLLNFVQLSFLKCAIRFLGHYITNNRTNDLDNYRQCHAMYEQASLGCALSKLRLLTVPRFTPLHSAHLWCPHISNSMQKLTLTYIDWMMVVLKVSWSSPTCSAVLCNLKHVQVVESVTRVMRPTLGQHGAFYLRC